MRERYERELKVLHDDILKMGLMVERALNQAMAAVKATDPDLAEEVVAGDADIDRMEESIEVFSAGIIVREQPVAGDLRDILTAMRVASELERMGDHARNLAKRAGRLGQTELSMALPLLETMMELILSMMKDALEAFTEHDIDAAQEIAGRDAEVDRVHDELSELLVGALRGERDADPGKIVPLLFLNRFLERLGDRVTNMCEWIYYARTGERLEMNKSHRL